MTAKDPDRAGLLDDSPNDDAAPSPSDAWQIIQREQAHVADRVTPAVPLLYALWGTAWLLGFGAFFAVETDVVDAATWVAGVVFAGLIAAAAVLSVLHVVRRLRGVRGAQDLSGALYGWSWTIAMVGTGALLGGLARLGVSDEVSAVMFPAGYCFVVGLLYLGGGATWKDRLQYGVGVWLVLTAIGSVYAGSPASYLVLALAGGGSMFAAAAVLLARRRAEP